MTTNLILTMMRLMSMPTFNFPVVPVFIGLGFLAVVALVVGDIYFLQKRAKQPGFNAWDEV